MQSLTVVLDRTCVLNNHNVYVFNIRMRLNSTGVAEGLPGNVRDRTVQVRSSTEKFFQLLESTLDRVAMHGIEFRKTRELKVDF